jgi:hypothetical protein
VGAATAGRAVSSLDSSTVLRVTRLHAETEEASEEAEQEREEAERELDHGGTSAVWRRAMFPGPGSSLLVIACVSVVYAVTFPIYLAKLYHLLHADAAWSRALGSLVLVGGVLLISLHAVSDIGITGLFGAKLASYSAQHDPSISYTLYYMTFALDSVGDVFGSVFLLAAGLLIVRTNRLPRWLAWVAFLSLRGH